LFVLALAFSVWAIVRTGEAMDEARRATEVAVHLEREYRLAQEDLMMLRNVMRANGITVETAGEHQ